MQNPDIVTLAEMIKDIKFTMLTTLDRNGKIHSRPMGTIKIEDTQKFDGSLWFFTKKDSGKVHEIEDDQEVNLSYAHPEKQKYVSVSGIASVTTDKAKMKELWNPIFKAWFPEGLEDPQICLIQVKVESADLWDSPNSKVVQLVGFAKSVLTGKPLEQAGTMKHIDLGTH